MAIKMKQKMKGGRYTYSNMSKGKTITIIVLAVLLAVAFGYIGFIEYQKYNNQQQLSVFQQGAQYGYEQAIIQVAQQAVTCEQVPLRIEN